MRRNNHTNRIEKTTRTYKNKYEKQEEEEKPANNRNNIKAAKEEKKNGVFENTAKSHFSTITTVKHGRRAKTDISRNSRP